jgi:nitrite reductase/ring-hydroxylating ferredoxin subunit
VARPTAPEDGLVAVASLAELEAKGRLVVRGPGCPILLVHDRGRVFALDNRCPHLGFPLHRGSIDDGILTCHWHHARFDLASGGTFDLWADDVPTCPVVVRDARVWVRPAALAARPASHWRERLDAGLAHALDLVIAKAVHGLLDAGEAPADILARVARFGTQSRDGWGVGLTILTALGNLLPLLPRELAYLALFHGARRVAADCADRPPRRERAPLAPAPDPATLHRWLRHWSAVRHRNGAERTLLAAIAGGASPAVLTGMLLAADTDRAYADGGHSLDFINKALECLDLIGWQEASRVLPTVVGQMVAARGREESPSWRQPVDLIALLARAFDRLPEWLAAGRGRGPWQGHAALAHTLLGDDPSAIVAALGDALAVGATGGDLGRAVAYAAALRIARFGTANELGDWETALHSFTFANAVRQALVRIEAEGGVAGPLALRAVFHAAMSVHQDRYLNVPPARLPGEAGDRLDDLPRDPAEIRAALLTALDRRDQGHPAGRLVARHLTLGHPPEPLLVTLAEALLREDSGFHAFQMVEAGIGQFRVWGDGDPGRHILVAVARYLAAHSPTERAALQTADIARRLMRGGRLHEEADGDG